MELGRYAEGSTADRVVTAEGASFEQHNQGLHPWTFLTSAEPDSVEVINGFVRSTRLITRARVLGELAYNKHDRVKFNQGRFDGAREKIAADLAQLLAVNVPATLLWKDGDRSGALQVEPPMFVDCLEYAVRSAEVDPEGFAALSQTISNAYSPCNVFLDVWVGNVDRGRSCKNLLQSQTSTGLTIWLTDFDLCLSHLERPWDREPTPKAAWGTTIQPEKVRRQPMPKVAAYV